MNLINFEIIIRFSNYLKYILIKFNNYLIYIYISIKFHYLLIYIYTYINEIMDLEAKQP